MANGGWYGSDEEWRRIEAPLILLDPTLDSFAATHGLSITRNHKDWPERAMAWGEDVRCLIQLYLDGEASLGVNFWICASQDRDGNRYWKGEFLRKAVEAEELLPDLPDLLEQTIDKLALWRSHPAKLEFATRLGGS